MTGFVVVGRRGARARAGFARPFLAGGASFVGGALLDAARLFFSARGMESEERLPFSFAAGSCIQGIE